MVKLDKGNVQESMNISGRKKVKWQFTLFIQIFNFVYVSIKPKGTTDLKVK